MQSDLDARLSTAAHEPRRDHPGVVEHQQIARAQQLGQIPHAAVLECPLADDQQAGGIARPRRMLRDQLLRQVEVEQIDAHAREPASTVSLAQKPSLGQSRPESGGGNCRKQARVF